MAFEEIAAGVAAGNGSAAVIYQMPADSNGHLANVTAYNSTGGALTLTITVFEADGSTSTLYVGSLAGGATGSFSGTSANCITPVSLLPGSKFQAQGSGAGIRVRVSGLRFY